jgi:phosphocarrier protein
MIKHEITIINKLGLHARAAAKFVSLASNFESDIELECGDKIVNGKSILGVMMLAASRGTNITLIVSGNDENEAVQQLTSLVEDRFGEDD